MLEHSISLKILTLLVVTALVSPLAQAAPVASAATPSVMSFQDWKAARVDEAKQALETIQKEKGPATAGKNDKKADAAKNQATESARRSQKSPRADQKLQQAQLNLTIAQELSVNDYFVIYLSQLKDREAFVEVAKKLTPEEAAEIMMAYQKQLVSPAPVEIVVPSGNIGSINR